jgi:hypothetical protein
MGFVLAFTYFLLKRDGRVENNSGNNTITDMMLYILVHCTSDFLQVWFSLGTPVSTTNKTDSHNITEILLKVA